MVEERYSGGCQCGAVRYALHQRPDFPHICHCRMCQKAFGSMFAPLTGVPLTAFECTRGDLAIFKSSEETERGFCRDCGTPLTFRHVDSDDISVSIGSLDDPEKIAPTIQCGIESRLSWFAALAGLPEDGTTEAGMPELARKIAASSQQHPDHDTGTWPPA
ncbi:GFA family protein [Bauldia litoralis]|uniref:GFA family protein n=1 Tax=Bauldia litoralis TaxID=665467 RepID=UPI0032634C65